MARRKKKKLKAVEFGDTVLRDSAQAFNIGQLNGDFVSVNRAGSSQSNTKGNKRAVTPCSTIPFPRDPHFVGREDVLNKIREGFGGTGAHQRLGLYGIGGIGKSQIAIEYAYRRMIESPGISIFWIYCDRYNNFEQSVTDIAQKLRLPGCDNPEFDAASAVSRWLDDAQNGEWLILMDNADDSTVLQESRGILKKRTLFSYIPSPAHGKVLITSRDRVAAYNLVGDYNQLIFVERMDKTDSLSLLNTRVAVGDENQDASVQLVEALEHIPLAITQAGAYIREMEPLTMQNYVEEFLGATETDQAEFLSKEFKDLRRHESGSNAVFTTWQISFDHIRKEHPHTADLLSLVCMFHRENIPVWLIEKEESKMRKFREHASRLQNYCLISLQKDWTISMHNLVQLATRTWLQGQMLRVRYQRQATKLVEIHQFDVMLPNTHCLIPHLEELADIEFDDEETTILNANILLSLADYSCYQEQYQKGIRLAQRAQKTLKQCREPSALQILRSLDIQLKNHDGNGSLSEAEDLCLDALGFFKPGFPQGWAIYFRCKRWLALSYFAQARFDEAVSIQLEILSDDKHSTCGGAYILEALSTVRDLHNTYRKQNRLLEAETLKQVRNELLSHVPDVIWRYSVSQYVPIEGPLKCRMLYRSNFWIG